MPKTIAFSFPAIVYKFQGCYEAHARLPLRDHVVVLTATGDTKEVAETALYRKAELELMKLGVDEVFCVLVTDQRQATRAAHAGDTVESVLPEPTGVQAPVAGELAPLMKAARERAGSIAADRERPQVIDYMQHIYVKHAIPHSAMEANQRRDLLVACLLALKPLADIADEYDRNGLEEARPSWVESGATTFNPCKDLYSGRGGKTLLTLQHALKAREVLQSTVTGRALTRTFRAQKHALKEIQTWVDSAANPESIIEGVRKALKGLDT